MNEVISSEDIFEDNDIFDELKNKGKIRASITIDKTLMEELDFYKKENNIKDLSPMINIMLWDWIKKNKRGKNGKKI